MTQTTAHAQSTNSVLMIRPGRFYPNPETAADNAFQRNADGDSDALTPLARKEFDAAVQTLEGIDPGADLRHGSARLAALLQEWHDASALLSEQLGLRFFSHVGEVNRQTFAT